jgi:hypothetical protein
MFTVVSSLAVDSDVLVHRLDCGLCVRVCLFGE